MNIEEELSYLAEASDEDMKPLKPLERSGNSTGFMSSFLKFLQGEKEASPPPAPQARPRPAPPPPAPPPLPPQTRVTPKEFPGDPQDDPRYFPLPKSSDSRNFDSSEDSEMSSSESDCGRGRFVPALRVAAVTPSAPPSKRPTNDALPAKLQPLPSLQVKGKDKKKKKGKKETPQKEESLKLSCGKEESMKLQKEMNEMETKWQGKSSARKNVIYYFSDSDSSSDTIKAKKRKEKKRKKKKKKSPNENKNKKRKICESSDEDDIPLSIRAQKLEQNMHCIKNKKSTPTKNNNKKKNQNISEEPKKTTSNKIPFKINAFILFNSDLFKWNPPLWRVLPKGALQRYDPVTKDGVTLYLKYSYSCDWNSKDESMAGAKEIPMKVLGQKLSLTIAQPLRYLLLEPPPSEMELLEDCMDANLKYQDNFEVYIQTLFSQALDSNFLLEIFQEKDDYFLSNVHAIDDVTAGYVDKLWEAGGWTADNSLASVLRERPSLSRESVDKKSKCEACRKPASSRLTLSGKPYHPETLRPISESPTKSKGVRLCTSCCVRAELGHRLVHQKCGLFAICLEAVHIKRQATPEEDTTAILNHLLADEPWTNQLFKEVRMTWAFAEKFTEDSNWLS